VYGEWFVESHRLGGARVSVGNPTLARHLVMFCVQVTVWGRRGREGLHKNLAVDANACWLDARGTGERGRREGPAREPGEWRARRECEKAFLKEPVHTLPFSQVCTRVPRYSCTRAGL
jgi:hypothetical protein